MEIQDRLCLTQDIKQNEPRDAKITLEKQEKEVCLSTRASEKNTVIL